MRMFAKIVGWLVAGLLALAGFALTIGKKLVENWFGGWLNAHIKPPEWVNWVVIGGFAVVTLWVVGSALFAQTGTESEESE